MHPIQEITYMLLGYPQELLLLISRSISAMKERQKGPEEEHRHLGGIKVCEIEEDKATDGLVAIHLDKTTEIIIQGVDEGDPVLVLHMVGEEMILTHMVGEEMILTYIGGAESAPSLVMAVVIVD
ncbi:hypothetical protein Golob_008862, partial [Gossypium lobatum]|nr:hypothetical protein [Gossypium lobatum]